MKNTIFPHKFGDHFWISCLSYFWTPICVISSTFVKSSDPPLIPKSSGQLAELIVYIIPPELICIVTKSYQSRTLWPDDLIRLFPHYATSFSSLCRHIRKYWPSEMLVSVCLRLNQSLDHLSCKLWSCVYSAYPFFLWWFWEHADFILLLSNRKCEPFAIV